MAGDNKELHGNMAKVDPKTKISPLYATNTAAISSKKQHETPVVDDENVAHARNFVTENKK